MNLTVMFAINLIRTFKWDHFIVVLIVSLNQWGTKHAHFPGYLYPIPF